MTRAYVRGRGMTGRLLTVCTPKDTFRTQRARLSRLSLAKKERAGRKSCSLSTSVAIAQGKNCDPRKGALFRAAADPGELQIPPLRYATVGMTKGRTAIPFGFVSMDGKSSSPSS